MLVILQLVVYRPLVQNMCRDPPFSWLYSLSYPPYSLKPLFSFFLVGAPFLPPGCPSLPEPAAFQENWVHLYQILNAYQLADSLIPLQSKSLFAILPTRLYPPLHRLIFFLCGFLTFCQILILCLSSVRGYTYLFLV